MCTVSWHFSRSPASSISSPRPTVRNAMRPTMLAPPTTQHAATTIRLVLKRLRLRIDAADLPWSGFLHADLVTTRDQQARTGFARGRDLEFHAFLVEAMDDVAQRLGF